MNKNFYGLYLFVLLFACDSNQSASIEEKVDVVFVNQSQFTLEALFLHDQPLNYKDSTNLITAPLNSGESLEDEIPGQVWYVTVYRRPNTDSEVLAYTTAKAWDAKVYRKITYFDEQFRVSVSE